MLTREENELICRTGAGTPMGELFRRFWLPAALASDLPEADCAPIRLKVLGESLIGFRDTTGRVGILDRNCPTAWPTSSSGATKSAASAAPTTDGNSTPTATVWRCPPRPRIARSGKR